MSPEQLSEAAKALVERTCAAQGLPPTIADAHLLSEVATMIAAPPSAGVREAS